jgi:hypothetical protein
MRLLSSWEFVIGLSQSFGEKKNGEWRMALQGEWVSVMGGIQSIGKKKGEWRMALQGEWVSVMGGIQSIGKKKGEWRMENGE